MKKICFFAHSNTLNGANRSMLDFIEHTNSVSQEYYFIVVIPKQGAIEKELKIRGIDYVYIKSYAFTKSISEKKSFKVFVKNILKKIVNKASEKKIKKLLIEKNIDLVHVNNTMTFLGAKISYKLSIPYIYHLREFLDKDHGLLFDNNDEMKKMFSEAYRCIAISDTIDNYYKNKYELMNVERVYNGLPVHRYNYDRLDFFKYNNTITVFGRLTPGKDQFTVIKAFNEIIKKGELDVVPKLLIIGSDDSKTGYKKELAKYVSEKKIDKYVEFIEHTDDVLEYRKKSNITIVSSLSEAFGRVTVEGMMATQLVIASDSGANTELISDGINGALYQTENFVELSQKIVYYLNNHNKLAEISKNSQEWAIENFSIERTTEKLLSIYDGIE